MSIITITNTQNNSRQSGQNKVAKIQKKTWKRAILE